MASDPQCGAAHRRPDRHRATRRARRRHAAVGGQRVGQAAAAWCHDSGQTTAFTVVRSGFLTTALAPQLPKRTTAVVREPLPAVELHHRPRQRRATQTRVAVAWVRSSEGRCTDV